MKVLIVDDSGSVRSVIRQMLRDMGHDTVEAANGKEALAQLEAHPDIGFVTLDWNMPEMDGIQMLDALQAKGLANRPTIMMVTTENEMDKIVKAMVKGANEYIMKPFTKEVLAEKLGILGINPTKNHAA